MKPGFLGSIVALLAGAGLALAQAPAADAPAPSKESKPAAATESPLPAPAQAANEGQSPAPNPLDPDKPNPAWSSFPLWAGEGGGASPGHFYVLLDYVLGWTKGDHIPPLVTTGPPSSEGIIGNPGTTVLFGDSTLNTNTRSGISLTAGMCLSECLNLGLQANVFGLFPRSQNPVFSSDQFPVLGRPFIILNPPGGNFAEITTFPNLATGNIAISNNNRFWGAESNLCHPLCCCECSCWKVALQAGFRYLNLREELTIRESVFVNPNASMFPQFASIAGDFFSLTDKFATTNDFYGPQIGVSADYWWGKWVVNLRGKVALGATYQKVDIEGSETVTTPTGQSTTFVGGLLALGSNIGVHSRYQFGVVPEVGADIGYWFTPHIGGFVGGSFLYWNNVLRPGEQIDRVIDASQIPNFPVGATPTGQNRPAVLFKGTDFWAERVTVGVVLSW